MRPVAERRSDSECLLDDIGGAVEAVYLLKRGF